MWWLLKEPFWFRGLIYTSSKDRSKSATKSYSCSDPITANKSSKSCCCCSEVIASSQSKFIIGNTSVSSEHSNSSFDFFLLALFSRSFWTLQRSECSSRYFFSFSHLTFACFVLYRFLCSLYFSGFSFLHFFTLSLDFPALRKRRISQHMTKLVDTRDECLSFDNDFYTI